MCEACTSNINTIEDLSLPDDISQLRVCPTCEGAGKISKDSEAEYIALIPIKDKRLRPRRVLLKVCIAVVLCIIFSVLLMIFLLPRSVDVVCSVSEIIPKFVKFENAEMFFQINETFELHNQNFLSIWVTNILVQYVTDYESHRYTVVNDSRLVSYPMRSNNTVNYQGNFSISGSDTKQMWINCHQKYFNFIYIFYTITVKFQIIGQDNEASVTHLTTMACNATMPPVTTTSPRHPTTSPRHPPPLLATSIPDLYALWSNLLSPFEHPGT